MFELQRDQDDVRVAMAVAGANVLLFLAGALLDLMALLGISVAGSVALLLTAYLSWVWRRPGSAVFYALGSLPLWLLLVRLA